MSLQNIGFPKLCEAWIPCNAGPATKRQRAWTCEPCRLVLKTGLGEGVGEWSVQLHVSHVLYDIALYDCL